MDIIIYSILVIYIAFLAFLSQSYNAEKLVKSDVLDINNERIKLKKSPVLSIIIIAIILAIYSANLATSGKLIDTVRYSWSFIYRYPLFTDSLEQILSSKTEPGFLILNKLILNITNEPFWIFFIIALITTIINLYSISKFSKHYTIIIILYLLSLYFFQSIYLIRQTIAVSIGNLGYLSYLKGNKLRPYMYIFIALLFHYTAIVLLPFIVLIKYGKTIRVYMILFIFFILFFVLYNSILTTVLPKIPYVNQYTESLSTFRSNKDLMSVMKGIPYYFITLLAIIKRKELKQHLFKADFYILSSFLHSFSMMMTYNIYWYSRMGMYFLLPTLALIPSLFVIIKNPKERLIYYVTFFTLLIIITYRQIFITLN